MARRGRDSVRGWVPSMLLAVLTAVLAVVGPPLPRAHASGDPSSPPADPPPPDPLVIPADWYPAKPAASIDYLPMSSTVTPAGQLALTIPIDTPPARGMGPSLALSYTSTSADGLLGVGWSLDGLSAIARCRKTLAASGQVAGVRYTAGDNYCLDGQKLAVIDDAYEPGCKEYRTERDIFARIVGCGDTVSGPAWFRVWTKAGHILFYEGIHYVPTEEGLFDTTDVLVAWPLRDAQDRSGNLVRYTYEVSPDPDGPGGFYYRPLEIEYTRKAAEPPFVEEEAGLRKVVFEYEDRPDPSITYLGGIRYGMPQRLAAINLIAPNPEAPDVVGRYELSYEVSSATGRSLLSEVRRCDRVDGPEKACLWAKQFSWWQSERPDFEDTDVSMDQVLAPEVAFFSVLDADGDGRDDLLAQIGYRTTYDQDPEIWLYRGSSDPADQGFRKPILVNDPYDAFSAFHFIDLAASRGADIDGDGRFELLAFVRPPPDVAPYVPGFQWFRWSDEDLRFQPFGDFLDAGGPSAAQLTDFDGDGLIDLLRAEPAPAIPAHWLLHRNVGGDLSSHEATALLAFEPGRAIGVDLDGDGRGELFAVDPIDGLDPAHLVPLGLGDSGQLGPVHVQWIVQSQEQNAILPTFADINGDGLEDALRLSQDPKQVRYNTGQRFLPPEDVALPGALVDSFVEDNGVRAADFDGDGRQDLLVLEGLNEIGQHAMRLFLSRPGGFVLRELGLLSGYKAPHAGWTTTKLGDFNGDGWLDVARMLAETEQSEGGTTTAAIRINVLLQKAIAPENAMADLIFEVRDEHAPAARESVFYTTTWNAHPQPTSCKYPQLCLRRGFPVVRMAGTSTIDPVATRWTLYEYDDPRADVRGRGFLGFGSVRAFDPQLRVETTTTFDHQTRIDERYPFAGLPKDTTHIVPIYELPAEGEWPEMPVSPIRGHVTSIHHAYTYFPLNEGATYYTPVSAWSRTEFETDVSVSSDDVHVLGPGGAEERRTQGTMLWDDFGNPTYDFAFTWGGSARLTQHSYDNLPDDWHIGLLRQSLESAGTLGDLPSPRKVTFDYDDRGRLERTKIEPDDPALHRRIHYLRNGDGLVEKIRESVTGGPVRSTHFAYDPEERMFLRAVWNDLGHDRQRVTHPALGLPLVTQDENGVQVRRTYDTFGRVLKIEPDGGAPLEIDYAADTRADPAHPHGLAITEKSAGAERTTYVDEWGRATGSATLAFDGQTIVHKTAHNAFGQPVRVHRPGFGAPSPLFTETTFDTLGRVTAVERPNGDRAETAYSMFEILSWDFDHHLTRLRLDADGRAVESARFVDHWLTTSYAYGPFGALSDVWDAEGNHTEITHDRLGRRTVLDDPDKGVWTYEYNGFGELVQRDDADPATPSTVLHRDTLGRVTAREDADGKTLYTYDAPGALGKPWTMKSPDGVTTELSYDPHGRPWKTTWTLATQGAPGLGDGTYEIERAYDGFGRVSEVRYPAVPGCNGCTRFDAEYTYTATGYLHQVRDARAQPPLVLWQVEKRNADGLLQQSRWAANLASIGQQTPLETRGYDAVLGRLESIITTAGGGDGDGGGGEIFHLGYGHDPNGNVTSRTDPLMGRTEVFEYDNADRLERWTLTAAGKSRQWSYEYDDLDNLDTVSEDGVATLSHTYGAAVPGVPKVKPHALTGITGAVVQAYHYDARGRQIEGGNRGITWTEFDLPRQITNAAGTTVFHYDALGTRIRKTQMEGGLPVASTVTLGGLYERREDTQAGTVSHVFYVHAEGAVAQVTYEEASGEETTRYLQHDGLGSVALVFDEAGTVHDRRFFEPFGQRIDASGGAFGAGMAGVELGFTGHRHDAELGLIDMRGRVYDPVQKHFLTPDPIIGAPLAGQDLNQYAYCWNNPLSIVDPTGLQEAPRPSLFDKLIAGLVEAWIRLTSSKPPPQPPPQPPKTTQPSTPTADARGTKASTGPNAQPTPQELPPAPTPKPAPEPEVDPNGFVPYDRNAQRAGGFVVGVGVGVLPYGSPLMHTLIANGILGEGTPEAREGLVKGELVGGFIALLYGKGKSSSSAPVDAPRPIALTTGLGTPPPLVVVPNATGVVVGAGGVVNVAAAAGEMTVALSTGGGDGGSRETGSVTEPKGGTYVLRDRTTGKVMRTGRTNDLARRAAEHARDPELAHLRFETVHKTDAYTEQRGLEQLLHEEYRPALNRIAPIDPNNPNRETYLEAAKRFLEAQ